MNIAITGGGTGGHLIIAKSVAIELNRMGIKPIFIGSTYGMDQEWFKDSELFRKCYFQNTSGVMNKDLIRKILSLSNIIIKAIYIYIIFKKEKIDRVFSVGGYSSAPCSISAILFRKKLFIHEQNSVTGTINRILKPYAFKFYNSFTNSSDIYPVDKDFFKNRRIRNSVKTIIFMGGSLGANAINKFAIKVAPKLKELGINIIHQTGINGYQMVKDEYQKINIDATVFAFSDEIYKYMNIADLAISRSGASSLWSLCANGLVTLYIPYPYATQNHQKKNIEVLLKKDLCYYSDEKNLSSNILLDIIKNNLTNKSEELMKLVKKNGAYNIAKDLINK